MLKKWSIVCTNFLTDAGTKTFSNTVNSDTQHYNDKDEGTYSIVGQ